MIEDWAQPLPPLRETQDQLYATALKNRAELQALRTLTKAQDETIWRRIARSSGPSSASAAPPSYAKPNQAINPYSARSSSPAGRSSRR